MDAAVLELRDIFGLADEKAERVASLLKILARREMSERIEARVEKKVAKEARLLSTKDDLHGLEVRLQKEISSVKDRLLMWMLTGFIAVLLGIIAVLVAVSGNGAIELPGQGLHMP